MTKLSTKEVQEKTLSVVAPIPKFPGYFIDRDLDEVISVKSGTPRKLKINKVGKNKVVRLGKTTRKVADLRTKVKTFRDKRPDIEPNVYNPNCTLTVQEVREIRGSSLPQNMLAAAYGVAPSTISSIINRKTWRWVK